MAVWIVGASDFGRETLDAALAAGVPVSGFLDDSATRPRVRGLPVRGLTELDIADFVVAIADPVVRLRLVPRLLTLGLTPASIIDPRAVVGPETVAGAGSVILATAFVSSGVTLGAHTHVNYQTSIGHDTTTEEGVTILPGANVGGQVILRRGALVGSGAVVMQDLEIGELAVIGAGAVVTRDVAPGTTVVGVPARPLRR